MSAIFLSYRRDDSSGYAGRLFDNLVERFGREQVFMDIETLEPGLDFVDGIDRAIESCGAVVAVIGPNWLSATNSDGRRRLDDPHDFIRLEISTALRRRVRVIPVLVYNASMPPEDKLPELLRPLCRLQSFEISDNRWEFDVHRLADVLAPLIAAVTLLVVGAIVGATWWFSQQQAIEPAEQTSTGAHSPPLQAEPSDTGQAPATVSTSPLAPPAEPQKGPEPEPVIVARPAVILPQQPDVIAEPPPDVPAEPEADIVAEPPPAPRPSAALQPDPSATRQAAEQQAQREKAEIIEQLLSRAQTDLVELRLSRPAGNNALERYDRVLELDPGNPDAERGLQAITERYHGLVEAALGSGSFDTAERHLESARAVNPGSDWLQPMRAEIQRRRRAAASAFTAREAPPGPDRAVEACVRDCENHHQACRKETDPDAEAVCLRDRAAACDEIYEACMSDGRKLVIWGRASLTSECAGVHAQCEREASKDCSNASLHAGPECDRRLEQCIDECQSKR